MSHQKVQFGLFNHQIPFAKWGFGSKTMVIFSGGPGNAIEKGMGFRLMTKCFDPFIQDYTLYLVTRKQCQSTGYTTRDMSDDYAHMIQENFGGYVDLIIGMSYGGLIAQHFAADHPDCFNHIVFAIASHRINDHGKEIDTQYALYLSEGKYGKALATISEALYPKGFQLTLVKLFSRLFGRFLMGKFSSPNDAVIEADAELAHDSSESLARIKVPVLIVGGTEDKYFSKESFEEMAEIIKTSTLKLYEGKGHMTTMEDSRFYQDVCSFTSLS